MARARQFDWEAARVRRAAGETYSAIARDYGVTPTAVRLACDDGARALQRVTNAEWQRDGRCPDCGVVTTRKRANMSRRCRQCDGIAKARSVRPDELMCLTCREWKPDDAFPRNRGGSHARRGRHDPCRVCQTKQRRAYRDARKVPCSHGCGTMVLHERRDRLKPPECQSCANRRTMLARLGASGWR